MSAFGALRSENEEMKRTKFRVMRWPKLFRTKFFSSLLYISCTTNPSFFSNSLIEASEMNGR